MANRYIGAQTNAFWSINVTRIKADVQRVRGNLDRLLGKMLGWVSQAMHAIALDWMSEAQRRLAPQKRSGELHNSAQIDDAVVEGDAIVKRFGFNAPYAAFRDHGGTITARRSDMLSIPLSPILDANGTSRYQTPRQEPKLFLVKMKDGRLFLAMRVPGGLEFHWKLQKSVKQDGSFYFSAVVSERRAHVAALLGSLFARKLEEENRATG